MASDSPVEVILVVGVLAVLAATFPYIAGALVESGGGSDATRVDQTVVIEGSTDWLQVGQAGGFTGRNETVRDSRGFSMQFTGANDSLLQSDASVDLVNSKNWSVTTGIWVNSTATDSNMTILAVGEPDLMLLYDNSTGAQANFSAVYMTATNTYRANVSAPADVVTNSTVVMAVKENDNLTVYANTTAGETVNVSGSNTWGGALTTAGNCHCRLDETRVFNSSLNSGQRSMLVSDPIVPLTNATRTARVMYDAGSGPSVNIYWASTSGTASNATYSTGFAGNELDESGALSIIISDGDYHWDTDGPKIRVEEGGRLDGAPAAFVEYDRRGIKDRAIDEVATGYEFIGTVMLVLVAGAVIVIVTRFRG